MAVISILEDNKGTDRNSKDGRQRNPVNMNGEVLICNICTSVFHWQRDYPDSYKNGKKRKSK